MNASDLNNISLKIQNHLETYKFIAFANINDIGWNMASEISRSSNLSAPDSIHLATALGSGSNILVTSDTFLIKEGNALIKNHNQAKTDKKEQILLEVITPEQAIKRLEG